MLLLASCRSPTTGVVPLQAPRLQLCWAVMRAHVALNGLKLGLDGVLGLHRTYTTLIGGSNGKGKSRLEQIIEWTGGAEFDGCIVSPLPLSCPTIAL